MTDADKKRLLNAEVRILMLEEKVDNLDHPEVTALAGLIHRNGGRIPEHERERAFELARRIDERAKVREQVGALE